VLASFEDLRAEGISMTMATPRNYFFFNKGTVFFAPFIGCRKSAIIVALARPAFLSLVREARCGRDVTNDVPLYAGIPLQCHSRRL